tara:strand:+ start:356 stop:739 length:384 start_codon:yes stop_codon:yes gene_type:complete
MGKGKAPFSVLFPKKEEGLGANWGGWGLTTLDGRASLGSSRHQSSPTSNHINHLGRAKHRSKKTYTMLEIQEYLSREKRLWTHPNRNRYEPLLAARPDIKAAEAFKAEYDNEQLPRFIEEANAQEDY